MRTIADYSASDHCFRKWFIGQFNVGIGFIVLKQNVVMRTMFLDEIRFENQRFHFVVNDDELKIDNSFYQSTRFRVEISRRLKILSNPTS